MKNLKKVLALVMAFAMAFTMMATAGAAYTDQADIEATEAVEMLNALGVMTGDPDGAFRPNDTIKRSEACRMIYTIRSNSDNADKYADMQTSFTDIPSDAWYAGYVKHCQAAGIVSGTSATTFEPERDVTGVELALMCLRVMGYDPEKADIGGSTWSTRTISLATEAGLLDGVSTSSINSPIERQWAAQLMYNMIQAPTVQWSTDTNAYTQYFDDGEKRPTVGQEYLKLYTIVGTLTNVDDQNLDVSQTDSDYQDTDKEVRGITSFTNLKQDYTDLLGQKVKVMIYDKKSNSVLGVYPLEDNTSYTVNMKDIEKDGDKVKFDGKSYGFDDTTLRVEVLDVDGKTKTENVKSDYFDVEANSNANAVAKKIVTFVDNDGDGKLNIAFVTEYASAEVTYVGADRITADKTYKMEDHNISEDLAKDDFAMISWNRFDDCKDIAKAEVVVDTLASSKDKGNYLQYQIGDVWYNIAENDTSGWDNVTVGDTVKAYIVAGVIVDIDTDDGTGAIPTNIAVVVGSDTTSSLYGDQVKLRYFDGTLKTVTLDKVVKSDSKTPATALKGYAYKVSGSDSSTRLEELKGQKYNGYEYITAAYGTGEAVTDDSNDKLNAISGKVVDDNATVILYNPSNGNSKKITGKQFKAISSTDPDLATLATAGTAAFTKKVNGVERVLLAAVEVKDTNISGTSYDNYGYVTEDGVKVTNGDVAFQMWNGSENLNVKVESGSETDYTKGTLVAYSAIDNDYLKDAQSFGTIEALNEAGNPATDANLYVAANLADSSTVVTDGENVLNVTSDTHVLVVDSDAAKADEIGIPYTAGDNLKTAALKEDGKTYRMNMVYRVDGGLATSDDADLDLLVIDNTGAFDFNKPESGSAGSGNEGSTSKGDFTFTTTDKTVLEVKTADIQGDGNVIFTVNVLGNAMAANTKFDWEVFVNDIPVDKGDDVAANAPNYKTAGVQVKDGAKVTIALSDIKVAGMSNPSADDINNAFEQEGVTNVTVSGDVTGAVKVPEGKKLTLDDKAVLKDATVEGSVVVGDIDVSGDVDLSKANVTSIKKVDVQSGASLNVTAADIKDLDAGTLNVAAGGALKIADVNTSSDSSATLVGPATAKARIQTAEDTTVSLDLANGAMTIAGDAEIPAGQTWYSMLGPVAAKAKGLSMTVTGTLTVNGTLKLVSGSSQTTFTVSDGGSVVVAGSMEIAKAASVVGNNAITGLEDATLVVKSGSQNVGTISGIKGVESHDKDTYTWNAESETWVSTSA